jgi:ABC-type nitrate/sulfonate/bicarbonate transport system substrate-binding protein
VTGGSGSELQEATMRRLVRLLPAIAGLVLLANGVAAQALKMTIGTGVDPAFSQFYVASGAGIFEKNGLDVEIKTASSGSAMIPFLIGNQIQAAYGSDLAGVINHNVDPNIVAVAEGTKLIRWLAVVGKNIPDLGGLKGKRIGVTKGTSGEVFWRALSDKFGLKAADYTFINVEAPEEVAALERGDTDAFVGWEPWPTRAVNSVKGAKILIDAEGILNNRNYLFMYRPWIEQNSEAAKRFMRSMVEATEYIEKNRKEAAELVSKFLKMPLDLTTELMTKVQYRMDWDEGALDTIKICAKQLTDEGKMKKPLDWNSYVYIDLLKAVQPEAVKISSLPPS